MRGLFFFYDLVSFLLDSRIGKCCNFFFIFFCILTVHKTSMFYDFFLSMKFSFFIKVVICLFFSSVNTHCLF